MTRTMEGLDYIDHFSQYHETATRISQPKKNSTLCKLVMVLIEDYIVITATLQIGDPWIGQ